MVPRYTLNAASCTDVPIFLFPNTFGLELTDSVTDTPSRVGWESFHPLVESLDEEQNETALPYHLCSSSSPRIEEENNIKEKKKKTRKTVSFSNVQIREHGVIVGDHPCAGSLPLSLDWAHTGQPRVINVDTYEAIRAPHRRKGSDMHLSFFERKNVLKEVGGLTERDIAHEQRRAYFRDQANDSLTSMRRVQTVAAMQVAAASASSVQASHAAHAHAIACSAINPGCPINGPTVTACV